MTEFMQKYVTTEGVLTAVGFLWFVLSSVTPIPRDMLVSVPIPGLDGFVITPGLLVAISVVPVILKALTPGRIPFVGGTKTDAPPTEEGK